MSPTAKAYATAVLIGLLMSFCGFGAGLALGRDMCDAKIARIAPAP